MENIGAVYKNKRSMNLRFMITLLVIILVMGGLNTSCTEEYFDFSPYSNEVESKYKDTHRKNLAKLKNNEDDTDGEFSFVLIGDTHFRYHYLDEAIKNINSRDDIDFVIFAGDMAHNGQLKEFELFHEIMSGLEIPYFTVIGNHDYLSNGEKIYKKMFGEYNYTFTYKNKRFVMFDNVYLESNSRPDLSWLNSALEFEGNFTGTFVVSHLPPWADELPHNFEDQYTEILDENEVRLSLHGHVHKFFEGYRYDNVTKYITVESTHEEKEYCLITVKEGDNEITRVVY